jgi:integrase
MTHTPRAPHSPQENVMAVRQRGTGWQADACWKGQRAREQFTTQKDAIAWEHNAVEAMKKGKPVPAPRDPAATSDYTTLGGLVEKVKVQRWQKPGAHQMVSCSKAFVEFTGPSVAPVEAFTQTNVDDFLDDVSTTKQITASTLNKYRSALSVLVKRAMSAGVLSLKPDLQWTKDGQPRIRFYSEDEEALALQLLTQWCGQHVGDFFTFLIYTGARTWREGAALKWADVNERGRSVTFWNNKGDGGELRFRSVPLIAKAYDAIMRYKGNKLEGPFVTLNKEDLRGPYDRLRSHVPALADTVWYTARHTFASRMVQAGVDLYRVQILMGHTDPKMTQRYAHLAPRNLLDAVSVLEGPSSAGPKAPHLGLVVDNG